MKKRLVYDYVPCLFKYNGEKFTLSKKESNNIENYFDFLIKSGKKYTNGDLFAISKLIKKDDGLVFELQKTNYAHYLYTREHLEFTNRCKCIAVSSLCRTIDGFFMLAKMSEDTAFPSMIKCIGGAIDEDDIFDGYFSLENALKRELLEETGINLDKIKINNFKNAFISTRNKFDTFNFITIIDLELTKNEVYSIFKKHNDKIKENQFVELEDMIFIHDDKESIQKFISNSEDKIIYLNEVFEILIGNLTNINILNFVKQ